VVSWHFTWLVNSAAHIWGSRRFETRDDSRNNWWVAIIAFGEGWHNNHHAHPASARHGLAWYEFDLNWYGIRVLQLLRLAKAIRIAELPNKRATAPPKVSPPAPEPVVVPRQVPMPAMAPLEKIAPPVVEPQLTPPTELRPREVPVAPRTPPVETAPREESLPAPAPVAPVAPPKIERAQEPAVEVRPRDVPMPPLAPIEPVAPPKLERNLAPIVEPATPQRAPVETPAAAEREAAKATPITPRSDTVAPARERAAPVLAPGKAPSAPVPARNEAPASGELPRLRYGAPDVDDEVFRSRRDGSAPAAESGGPPAITAESLRRRAAEIAREGSGTSGVLNLVPPPPPLERKDTLAEGIAKAAKPDCRTAYGGMGLLAVVPLVASTVGNGGCRW